MPSRAGSHNKTENRDSRMSTKILKLIAAFSFIICLGSGCNTQIPPDTDQDGVSDLIDNCPNTANVNQADDDADGLGNECDNCPLNSNANQNDADGDGFGAACDSADLNPLIH